MKQQEPIEMQKITVELPKFMLETIKEDTGLGITALMREMLDNHWQQFILRRISKRVGTYKPGVTIEEMRSWEDD